MKNLYYSLLAFSVFLTSCGGKSATPKPATPPVDTPIVVTPPVKKVVYSVDFSDGVLNTTTDDFLQLKELLFSVSGKKNQKYYTDGNTKIRIKNIIQSNIVKSENPDNYTQRVYLNNMVQLSEKDRVTNDGELKDTLSNGKACVFITDPSKKDVNGNQIIQILYILNDGSVGADAIGFQNTKNKFGTKVFTAADIVKLMTRDDLRLL